MGCSEEYRWFAGRCLEIARTTADAQTRAAMLQMAQVWLRLADDIAASGERRSKDPRQTVREMIVIRAQSLQIESIGALIS